ncbi:hypothetical protein CAL12_20425 [Bordetella genomosp. 8]|uniref:Uncharacterized protein n=2 Tax=Bordetella TaxID=517 RepID=A0A193FZS4_9BORD|nr:hypothetical protein BAU08_19610 [Bordetella bronchialis]ARP82947.1 hypothetical protein CAL12_20425 [Bordetella genomosp. 8]
MQAYIFKWFYSARRFGCGMLRSCCHGLFDGWGVIGSRGVSTSSRSRCMNFIIDGGAKASEPIRIRDL